MIMKKHIVCFGDSNTHGYKAADNGRYDENERWTCLLQKRLGEKYLVLEEGLSGRTTCFDDPVHEGLSGLDYIYPVSYTHLAKLSSSLIYVHCQASGPSYLHVPA